LPAVMAGTVVIGRRAKAAELALIDDAVGVVVAARVRLHFALTLTIKGTLITGYNFIAKPTRSTNSPSRFPTTQPQARSKLRDLRTSSGHALRAGCGS